MRPKTPSRIHPSRLLLSPRLSPVPSVDIRSSTSASAGDDVVIALAAARSDDAAPPAGDDDAGAASPFPLFPPSTSRWLGRLESAAPHRCTCFSPLTLSCGSPTVAHTHTHSNLTLCSSAYTPRARPADDWRPAPQLAYLAPDPPQDDDELYIYVPWAWDGLATAAAPTRVAALMVAISCSTLAGLTDGLVPAVSRLQCNTSGDILR